MGTSAFFKQHGQSKIGGTSMNLEARALGAPGYAGTRAGQGAAKDLAAASALAKGVLKPGTKTAASNAPGPKKV